MTSVSSVTGKIRRAFGETIRSLRRLFLEIIAAFFVALAVIGIASTIDEYRRYVNSPEDGALRLAMSILFSSVMLISGLHTFLKARKIR